MEVKALSSFQEYSDERFTKRVVYQKGDSVAFVLNFMPGQTLPPHKHPGTEVYLLVLTGHGTMTADGEQKAVNEGDIINVGGEEQFSFENTGNCETSLYVILSKVPGPEFAKNV